MDSVWESAYLSYLGRDFFFIETTLSTESNKVHSDHSNARCAFHIKVLSSPFCLDPANGKSWTLHSFSLLNSKDITDFTMLKKSYVINDDKAQY